MTEIFCEKRANPRIRINGELQYLAPESNRPRTGVLEDISLGGACIWIESHLHPSSQLYFRIESDEGEAAQEFIATLLRILPVRKRSLYGYGCSIEKVPHSIN